MNGMARLIQRQPGGRYTIRLNISIVYALLSVATAASFYWRIFERNALPLFWLPLLALVSLQAWEVIVLARRDATHIVALVVSAVVVGILVNPEPFQLFGYDVYSEASFAQSIVDTGKWDPTLGTAMARNYYGYYPCLHLIFGSLTLVTGLPVLSVFKYVAPLAVSVSVFAAAYFMFKRSFSIENAALATLIYVSSLGFVAVFPSRRATALVFGALFIALLFREPRKFREGRSTVITATILLGGLAFSDHFMGLIVLTATISCLIILRILKSRSVSSSGFVVLLGGLVYAGWYVFTASLVFGTDVAKYVRFFADLFSQKILAQHSLSMYGYVALERGVVLLAWGLFGLLALFGWILLFLKRRENRPWVVWGAIGIVIFGASTIMALHPDYAIVSTTLSWFGTLLLSALASLTVVKLSAWLPEKAKVVPLFLLMIMFSGAMLSVYGARTLDRSPNEVCVVEEVRGYSSEQYTLGKWIKIHSEPSLSILGDFGSYALLSGYCGISFVEDFSWPGRAPRPDEFKDVFVLDAETYFTCKSVVWKDVDPTLVESLGSLNRLWDGGTWRLLTAPPR